MLRLSENTIPKKKSGTTMKFSHPWLPDRGDGMYCNPILYADYSDPDVVRVGEDFFLVASSFNCTPGLPILHSTDLVNWTIVNHALKNLPQPYYDVVRPGCGVWAPAIRFHAGKFWIFFPTPDDGIFMVTADHPTGKWSEPHLVQKGKGLIDPCPLWDDDGRAYLVHAYAHSRSGIKHMLRVRPMAPDGSKLLGEGEIVFHDPVKHPTLEGPKFLKKDGWYYILAPAGGVETGWQVALRSRNIYGPYEDKIVLAQGDSDINGPHQGALVDTDEGVWWFVHFQDAGLYGRIVHLQPVKWQDGWPMMGKNGEPVHRHTKPVTMSGKNRSVPQSSDEFEKSVLGLQWQWNANHYDGWFSLTRRPGWLRLYPQAAADSLNAQPNLLLQKFPARSFVAETIMEIAPRQNGEEAGLVIAGAISHSLGVRQTAGGNFLIVRTDKKEEIICKVASNCVKLRVEVSDGGKCSFSFAYETPFTPTPPIFQATKGNWIGARIGLYSLKHLETAPSGHADFDYFRFKGTA